MTRRRFLGALVAGVAAGAWPGALRAGSGARPARLVCLLDPAVLTPGRAAAVVTAVRLALADASALAGVDAPRLVVVAPDRAGRWRAPRARAGEATIATLALTAPGVAEACAASAHGDAWPWLLVSATRTGSVARPVSAWQVGRDDRAIATGVADWCRLRARQGARVHHVADGPASATPVGAALAAAGVRDVVRHAGGEGTTPAPLGARRGDVVVLDVAASAAARWTVPVRALVAAGVDVVAPRWHDAIVAPATLDTMPGLVLATSWHPAAGGSERIWARRQANASGVAPGEAEVAAASAVHLACAAWAESPRDMARALAPGRIVRDVLCAEARIGPDRAVTHDVALRRRVAARDEDGWPRQVLVHVLRAHEAFATRAG